MKVSIATSLATTVAFSAAGVSAFTVPHTIARHTLVQSPITTMKASLGADDDEVLRLQSMAAKLREEAATLEAQQKQERAQAAEKAFRKFDTNGDGEVSLEELKAALEKTFKMDLPEERVERLLQDFDKNGDGKLQPEEFVGVEQFRNRLEQLASEERRQALELQRAAQAEAELSEMIDSQLQLINDRTPTGTDKLVASLPYLFPLLDSFQYGRFLLAGQEENPAVLVFALLYSLYRAVPLSGFLTFFTLSGLANNLQINRLVRYNIRQAILLDIALITPAFFGAILAVLGLEPPLILVALGSSAAFATLVAVIGYATVSNLAGITPDKVPLISDAVTFQMPPSSDNLEFDVSTGMLVEKKKKDENEE